MARWKAAPALVDAFNRIPRSTTNEFFADLIGLRREEIGRLISHGHTFGRKRLVKVLALAVVLDVDAALAVEEIQ